MPKSSPLATYLKVSASATASLIGGWILFSRFAINHDLLLPPAIDAERERFVGARTGFLSAYVSRVAEPADVPAPPLVLIHSINAAGSAYEVRPIFQAYRGRRDVYALDLPGFGFSERSDRVYSYDLYKQAIIDLLERIGQPADVLALSLSSEFAARAALERPDLFHSLALISPSGFNTREDKGASQAASQAGTSNTLYRLFAFPLWGQAFYDLLGTRRSIHTFLQMSFHGRVNAGLEAYSYQTTHQPGARYAPLYFVSGRLFSPNILEDVYSILKLPVLVLFDRDAFVRFDTLPDFVEDHPNWQAMRIAPTRGLPQFEKMPEVAQALDTFWQHAPIQQSH